MARRRCRHCQKSPVWRYRNNDIHACKRSYHVVWSDTHRRLRNYHAAPGALERGRIPAALAGYGADAHEVARALVKELSDTAWRTGARHEVPLLITRCEHLAERLSPGEGAQPERPTWGRAAVQGYDVIGMLRRLIVAVLFKDIRWREWQGRVKFVL